MKYLHLFLALTCWTIVGLCFSGCADMPVTVGVSSDYGSASYSAKGGLGLEVDASAIERRMTDPPSIHPSK